jgi:hypothetical protein
MRPMFIHRRISPRFIDIYHVIAYGYFLVHVVCLILSMAPPLLSFVDLHFFSYNTIACNFQYQTLVKFQVRLLYDGSVPCVGPYSLMFRSADGAMRLSHSLAGLDLRRRYRVPLCRVRARQLLSVWTTSSGVRALGV